MKANIIDGKDAGTAVVNAMYEAFISLAEKRWQANKDMGAFLNTLQDGVDEMKARAQMYDDARDDQECENFCPC